MRGAEHTES